MAVNKVPDWMEDLDYEDMIGWKILIMRTLLS